MKRTAPQRIATKYPGYIKAAGPYRIVQPMLPKLAAEQKKEAAQTFLTRKATDSTAKLVVVGRVAYIITKQPLVTVKKNTLVVSGGFQVKAGRGGWA